MAAADDLAIAKFLGFCPEKFYCEVYGVGYNHYLRAVDKLKEVLLQEFPEKQEEIETSCGLMLDTYSQQFDRDWFMHFIQYCSKNIFVVHPNTPLFDPELDAVEENQQASDKTVNLCHCIMATEYLNIQLLGRLRRLDAEIESRKELLAKVIKTEQKFEAVKRAKELLEQGIIEEEMELPEHAIVES